MVSLLFPSLFGMFAVDSVNYSDVVVIKSKVNPNCVIIKARKPVEWLLNHMTLKDLPASTFDNLGIGRNTDGSISVWNEG